MESIVHLQTETLSTKNKLDNQAQSDGTYDNDIPIFPGMTLGQKYSIESLLGKGGYGWVFSAIDIDTSPTARVALKVLKPQRASNGSNMRRFQDRELEMLLRVHTQAPVPNVVRARHETVMTDGPLNFLVLEFIDGPTLAEVMADIRTFDPQLAKHIVLGLARGLAAIHAAGGVHRDLKPSNIRLRDGTNPVILDLGISKALWETQDITTPGNAPMTPRYAAPEQFEGAKIGVTADIFALGLILYEMLVGDVPTRTRHRLTAPDPRSVQPSIPRYLAQLTLKCLAGDPTHRPTASEVVNFLEGTSSNSKSGISAPRVVATGALIAIVAFVSITKYLDKYPRIMTTPVNSTWEIVTTPPPKAPWSLDSGSNTKAIAPSLIEDMPLSRTTIPGVIQVSAGKKLACALTRNELWQWTPGQPNPPMPIRAPREFERINCAENIALILSKKGALEFHHDTMGIFVSGGITDVVDMAAANRAIFAVRLDGSVWEASTLNPSHMLAKREWQQIGGLPEISAIAASTERQVALGKNGSVWFWGFLKGPTVGVTREIAVPMRVPDLPTIVDVALGASHVLALDINGALWGWGDNSTMQIGVMTQEPNVIKPMEIPIVMNGARRRIKAISAAMAVSLVLDTEGVVWTWGGHTDHIVRESPRQVMGLPPIAAISTAGAYSVSLAFDGSLWTWGLKAVAKFVPPSSVESSP